MTVEIEHGAEGRWGGRLTRRDLPEQDASIDALPPADRKRLATIWQYRSATERRVADSFEVIAGSLARRGAPQALLDLARRAVDDEYRHTELSRVVASRYHGSELPRLEPLPLTVPKHRGASPELRDDLFVIGQCLFNETTASAFLECCVNHARGELASVALRELLSDEIEHGRMGWTYLASLAPERRARIEPWLLPMAFTNLKLWRQETPPETDESERLAEHGAPPAERIHEALVDALETLILPGLGELGMKIDALEAWLKKGAPTDRPPV
jgi:hypothetical protein